jgi:uncharacterized protein YccT (UPF0319 family)
MGEIYAFPELKDDQRGENQAAAAQKILAWWRQLSPEEKQAFREWMDEFYS